MKRIAVLSFIIGLLGVPIAAAQNAAPDDVQQVLQNIQAMKISFLQDIRRRAAQEKAQLQQELLDLVGQKEKTRTAQEKPQIDQEMVGVLANWREVSKVEDFAIVALREAQEKPVQSYPNPRAELQRQREITNSMIDFNRGQTQNIIDLMRSMNRAR
jgi:hypothetical protein